MTDPEFEALMEETAECDSCDAETNGLREIVRQLWDAMTPEQRAAQTFEFDPDFRY